MSAPNVDREVVEALISALGHHLATERPTHCDSCSLRWPCDEAEAAAALRALLAENEALKARLPREWERFVRVGYPEMVDRLKAANSEPVTLRIEERVGGELYLVATRWEGA